MLYLNLLEMKTIRKLFAVSAGLLILAFIEGVFTMGAAFNFHHYALIGWIMQGIAVFFTITSSLLLEDGVTGG
jgi:hypothetical protein